ncbi:Glutamine synthetase [Aphelenchoides besseyi]|nr:Glutamine synthetase [Aphelenchoides besseyi]
MTYHSNFNVKLPLGTPVIDQFLGIKPPTQCQATYVWVDETGECLRAKTRTFDVVPKSIEGYPIWNYAHPDRVLDSDLYLHPRAVYQDPFLGPNARLIMCDTYTYEGKPTATNYRHNCAKIMSSCAKEHPWFGMEQEYLILDRDGYPLGWPKHGFPVLELIVVLVVKSLKRIIVQVYSLGSKLGGTNGGELKEMKIESFVEVTPGQWEFQVGPCEGIDMGDQLWMARYLLHRVAEQFGVLITLDPKPAVTLSGEWNGAGCHCNFSTQTMREPNGLTAIEAAMSKLARFHTQHLLHYDANNGMDNLRRLSGRCETSNPNKFTWGIADRGASVRIPRQGYLEDRRPASNCDPYRVTACIADAILLN